ncbi:Rossmann-like and DUF2520 domain-containing protein [Selenihalanaerobacter shriftii]|uniref:Predicted oxidoreductase, contains short-chain dehydrogenase (SDR) and DUF2520 domains n=1 Tax=Selenihalanaerobacter shriftii TaxID=142842 RepID=A0A1T4QUE3_9FIRM|nr:Rossmann-like and DUF2520 domain-containing protein [Selenihalanaerobacter shriftii]SKA07315.1 Predicted oxidoreductase, contains short-chain dehydrogenase (SDR) and DUF2520 domains [Selenihalanaerobacter shriftii]
MKEQKTVVIIGAGSIGQSLGYLLAKNGYQILGFVSRSLNSAKQGVNLAGGGIATTEHKNFILKADLILITTPDQAIHDIADNLFKQGLISDNTTLIHCSGALLSDILLSADIEEGKYGRLALHPLQSVADVQKGISNLPNAFFTIEGNQIGREIGKEILKKLGAEYEIISKEAKPIYHAAACVASNYLVAIADLAIKMNEKAGIDSSKAAKGLLTLMEGTLNNIQDLGATQALTGPISRGDIEVIKNHLDSLEELLPEKVRLYRSLGKHTTEIAQDKGTLTEKEYTELINKLKVGER